MAFLRSPAIGKYLIGVVHLRTFQYAIVGLEHRKIISLTTHSYSTQPSARSTSLEEHLHILDQTVRKRKCVYRSDINMLIDYIAKEKINSVQSIKALMYFGDLMTMECPRVRTQLAQRLWKTLQSRTVVDISHYNALLNVYVQNEHSFTLDGVLTELKEYRLTPNRATYQRIVEKYSQNGDMDGIANVIQIMKNENLSLNIGINNALIYAYASVGNVDDAKAVIKNVKNEYSHLPRETYVSLLRALAKCGDFTACQAEIERLKTKQIVLSEENNFELVYEFAIGGYPEHCQPLLDTITKSDTYNRWAENIVLRLLQKKLDDVAFIVLKSMQRSSNVSGDIGNFYIKHMIRLNRPSEDISAACAKLTEAKMHSAPLKTWQIYLGAGRSDALLAVLRQLKAQGTTLTINDFNPLFQGGNTLETLRIMIDEFNVQPTFELLRDSVLYRADLTRPDITLRELFAMNISVNSSSLALAINCLRRNQIVDAANIMTQYRPFIMPKTLRRPLIQAFIATDDVRHYLVCLRALFEKFKSSTAESENNIVTVRNEEIGRIVYDTLIILDPDKLAPTTYRILKGMVMHGLTISQRQAERIKDLLHVHCTNDILGMLNKLASEQLIPVPLNRHQYRLRQSSETLENQLAKGTRHTQLLLLDAYKHEGKLDQYEKLLHQLEGENFKISKHWYAYWIEMKADASDLDTILQTLTEIQVKYPDFFMNSIVSIKIASLMIDKNRFDDALLFLEKSWRKEAPKESISIANTHCCALLDKVAATSTKNGEKLLRIILASNRVPVYNKLLSIIMQAYLDKNDIVSTVEGFERMVTTYKQTPLLDALLKHLIRTDDLTNMQRVVDIAVNVHGQQKCLAYMAFAFVDCGRLEQARCIFEMPAVMLKPHMIKDYVNRLDRSEQINYVKGFLRATENINHLDRSDIQNHLLRLYCNEHATEKALELWVTIQEANEVPTIEFLTILGEHLKSKGLKVPFAFPGDSADEKVDTKAAHNVISTPAIEENQRQRLMALKQALEISIFDNIISAYRRLLPSDALNDVVRKLSPFVTLLNCFASRGDVETVEEILSKCRGYQEYTAAVYLAKAYLKAGRSEDLLAKWTDDVIANDYKPNKMNACFPVEQMLYMLEKQPNYLPKCEALAIQYAEKGVMSPMAVIWNYYNINNNYEASDQIWYKYLTDCKYLYYGGIATHAYNVQDTAMLLHVIDRMKASPVHINKMSRIYTCLVDVYVKKNEISQALKLLETVSTEFVNVPTLERLKRAVEVSGQTFPYHIRQIQNTKTR